MKAILLFFITCIISSGAFLAATMLQHKWPAFLVGFGVWLLFIYKYVKRH